ncbi:hypothetical protein BJP36_43225 [Moorena producens JHB]|uniref:Uncharacterized protein n=1 Tax=Moorena producens (strain JHB) TaxID=1454205 RepID=A0A9Q9ST48_MOOP1|nr:hypothetical protein [Moorena producens]WAN69174.1 hypothetical protein BJP36_43225 [Moorena producens JHB]
MKATNIITVPCSLFPVPFYLQSISVLKATNIITVPCSLFPVSFYLTSYIHNPNKNNIADSLDFRTLSTF